jgi:hypothetical protein
VIDGGFGTQIDCCSPWSYLVTFGCWKMTPGQWNDVNNAYLARFFPTTTAGTPAVGGGKSIVPPPPPPPPADIMTTPPESGDAAQTTVNTLIDQNIRNAQQNASEFFAALPAGPPTGCTMTFPQLNVCDSTLWLIGAAAGAGLLLLAVIKR